MAATTALVLGGLSAATSIMGGIQANAAAKQQANAAQATAILQGEEQARVSAAQAAEESRVAESTRRLQKIQYLKSGVDLEGSPLLMMEATRLQGTRNVDEITGAGGAAIAGIQNEGRMAAKNYRASGRQALMSGIAGAAGTLATTFAASKFGSPKPTEAK